MDYVGSAWHVVTIGVVGASNGVYDSFGRRSPYTSFLNDNGVYLVYPDGIVDGYGVVNSYGRYNIISPSTVTNLDVFNSTTTGDVGHAGNTSIYAYSYGNSSISSHARISSLCRIAGLKELVFQLFYFHKGA